MSKMIKVKDETHKRLKTWACINNMSLSDYMEYLSDLHYDGLTVDVTKLDTDLLIDIIDDMKIELKKRIA